MQNENILVVAPLAGTGTTADDYIFANPCDVSLALKGIYFLDDAGWTGDNTNYATFSVEMDGVEAAISATTVTDLGTIAADTPVQVAVSNPNLVVAPGGKVAVILAKAGTGVAIAGRATLVFKPQA